MKIRKSNLKDTRGIAKLLVEYEMYEHKLDKRIGIISFANALKQIKSLLKNRAVIFFIAEVDDKMIGFVSGDVRKRGHENLGTVHNLFIEENQRGRGYGDALVAELSKHFKNHKCRHIRSFVRIENDRALKFWQKQGFNIEEGYSIEKKL